MGKQTIYVKEKQVEKVELPDEKMKIFLGSKLTLSAIVTPVDATYPEITWSSSDNSILEVDENGNLNTIDCGIVTVTATAKNGKSDRIEIEISEIVAEKIDITGANSFIINEATKLSTEFSPADTTVKDVIWSSSNPDIATVDEFGTVRCQSYCTS